MAYPVHGQLRPIVRPDHAANRNAGTLLYCAGFRCAEFPTFSLHAIETNMVQHGTGPGKEGHPAAQPPGTWETETMGTSHPAPFDQATDQAEPKPCDAGLRRYETGAPHTAEAPSLPRAGGTGWSNATLPVLLAELASRIYENNLIDAN